MGWGTKIEPPCELVHASGFKQPWIGNGNVGLHAVDRLGLFRYQKK